MLSKSNNSRATNLSAEVPTSHGTNRTRLEEALQISTTMMSNSCGHVPPYEQARLTEPDSGRAPDCTGVWLLSRNVTCEVISVLYSQNMRLSDLTKPKKKKVAPNTHALESITLQRQPVAEQGVLEPYALRPHLATESQVSRLPGSSPKSSRGCHPCCRKPCTKDTQQIKKLAFSSRRRLISEN